VVEEEYVYVVDMVQIFHLVKTIIDWIYCKGHELGLSTKFNKGYFTVNKKFLQVRTISIICMISFRNRGSDFSH
jgi:hypothetical protein